MSRYRQSGFQTALKAGLPLVVLLFGSAYGMSTFLQTQIEIKDKREQNKSVRVFSLEEEHKRLMKQLHIDNFSLSRIPRPDEVSKDKDKGNDKTIKKILPKPKQN